jgi:hypothetical protein
MRAAWAILSLTVTLTCFADSGAFDLMQIAQLNGKGRIQDQQYQPKIRRSLPFWHGQGRNSAFDRGESGGRTMTRQHLSGQGWSGAMSIGVLSNLFRSNVAAKHVARTLLGHSAPAHFGGPPGSMVS